MKSVHTLVLLILLTGCASSPSDSKLILSHAPLLSSVEAQQRADLAMSQGSWELANVFLLTALDVDPLLEEDSDFMRKLVVVANRMGIDDFQE